MSNKRALDSSDFVIAFYYKSSDEEWFCEYLKH